MFLSTYDLVGAACSLAAVSTKTGKHNGWLSIDVQTNTATKAASRIRSRHSELWIRGCKWIWDSKKCLVKPPRAALVESQQTICIMYQAPASFPSRIALKQKQSVMEMIAQLWWILWICSRRHCLLSRSVPRWPRSAFGMRHIFPLILASQVLGNQAG